MSYVTLLFLFGLVLGLIAVASNPSPYFAALGLVVVSGMGCGVLAGHGGSFLSLILFLIYLGGMLVVFAYSAALAAEPYPENWLSASVAFAFIAYMGGVVLAMGAVWGEWHGMSYVSVEEANDFLMFRGDTGGVSMMYSEGGGMLVLGAWVLLITLFVVLEVTRGLSRGALRAV